MESSTSNNLNYEHGEIVFEVLHDAYLESVSRCADGIDLTFREEVGMLLHKFTVGSENSPEVVAQGKFLGMIVAFPQFLVTDMISSHGSGYTDPGVMSWLLDSKQNIAPFAKWLLIFNANYGEAVAILGKGTPRFSLSSTPT